MIPAVALLSALTLLILASALLLWSPWSRHEQVSSPYLSAYQSLFSGKIEEARAQFETICTQNKGESRCYEGLAALAFETGEHNRAREMAEKAIQLDPQNLYSHVIKGNIALSQGNLQEAEATYRLALDKTHGLSWQKAVAYNRLGRVYSALQMNDQAMENYNKALALDSTLSETYSNKAVLLERLGRPAEALPLYQEAIQRNPNDPLAPILASEAKRRAEIAADQEKRERVNTLVAELVKRFNEGTQVAQIKDEWSSRPLTLSLLSFEIKGAIPLRDGEDLFLRLKLTDALKKTQRITVVEREVLDKLLEELNLGSSQLADPAVAVKVGKIMAARLISIGSLTRGRNDTQISLRVIETETTAIKAAFSEAVGRTVEDDDVMNTLTQKVMDRLRKDYPIRGKVAVVEGDEITLNIGTVHGVTPGLKLKVMKDGQAIVRDGRVIGYRKIDVGKAEVISVEPEISTARILEKTADPGPEFSVEEIREE
ncbi:MAG: tetratricopeptide repeat protein [Candidatus Tectomicrobia bacterium]|nr:tetratricopeptide repeat protein [Candidatus Tectomicrobia bacterium]